MTLKLTCDKLGRLLEVGKYEVGHYVKACKQEHTDLQKRQKGILFVSFSLCMLREHGLKGQCYFLFCLFYSLVKKLSCSVQYY